MTRNEHLLVCLAEECSEVAQCAAKALRFGLDDVDPVRETRADARLAQELTDLLAVVRMLQDSGVTLDGVAADRGADPGRMDAKQAKFERFLLYSQERGTLSGGNQGGIRDGLLGERG